MKKGQNFRLFIAGLCLAASKSCTLEQTAELEDISTKDSTGMAKENTVKGKAWNGSADALLLNETDTTGMTLYGLLNGLLSAIIAGQTVAIKFTETDGDKNRTVKTDKEVEYTGNAIINDITVKCTAKEEITFSVKFQGYGPLSESSTQS